MALEYSFQISTIVELGVIDNFFETKIDHFTKESLKTDVFLYNFSNPWNLMVYFSYGKNREITYHETGIDKTFYSDSTSTKLSIRLNNNYSHIQQNIYIYELIVFLLKNYESDCILRYLDDYMVFMRIEGKFLKGEFAKETLFKDIDEIKVNENINLYIKKTESIKELSNDELTSIVDAFQIASGQGYAISKTKVILDYLKSGQQIRITDIDENIIISSPEDLRQIILEIDRYVDIKNESELSSFFD